MTKYQIVETAENFAHAGSKATADAAKIAEQKGFTPCYVRMDTVKPGTAAKIRRQAGYFRDYKNCYRTVKEGAVVLLQHPFHYPQLTRERILTGLKEQKHCRFIGIVHDVEELRAFRYNDYYRREFLFMQKTADVWIVHNEIMKKFFTERGFDENRLVNLRIFDYLIPDSDKTGRSEKKFARAVTVAGNLDVKKCGYLGKLKTLAQNGVTVRLFGPNFEETVFRDAPEIRYEGAFGAEEIPGRLTEGFGLVWDGDEIDGCVGESGQYLRYNNPHKLSLYLAAGLPVVIWKQAAEAAFVQERGVGVCVDSLTELPQIFAGINEEDYRAMCARAAAVSEKLRHGDFMTDALTRALEILSGQ